MAQSRLGSRVLLEMGFDDAVAFFRRRGYMRTLDRRQDAISMLPPSLPITKAMFGVGPNAVYSQVAETVLQLIPSGENCIAKVRLRLNVLFVIPVIGGLAFFGLWIRGAVLGTIRSGWIAGVIFAWGVVLVVGCVLAFVAFALIRQAVLERRQILRDVRAAKEIVPDTKELDI